MTSFGIGQKGTQAIGIHPKYLFATLDKETFTAYRAKLEARQKKAYRYFHNGLINNSIFVVKTRAPYTDDQMSDVFLNPNARVSVDKKTAGYTYSPDFAAEALARSQAAKPAATGPKTETQPVV